MYTPVKPSFTYNRGTQGVSKLHWCVSMILQAVLSFTKAQSKIQVFSFEPRCEKTGLRGF